MQQKLTQHYEAIKVQFYKKKKPWGRCKVGMCVGSRRPVWMQQSGQGKRVWRQRGGWWATDYVYPGMLWNRLQILFREIWGGTVGYWVESNIIWLSFSKNHHASPVSSEKLAREVLGVRLLLLQQMEAERLRMGLRLELHSIHKPDSNPSSTPLCHFGQVSFQVQVPYQYSGDNNCTYCIEWL